MQELRVKSPGDLVAAVPHVLGFEPENSLVLVIAGSGAPTARVDLPTPDLAGEAAGALLPVLKRYRRPDCPVFLVAFTADTASGGESLNLMADRLRAEGHDFAATILVRGEEWLDTASGRSGVVAQSTKTLFAAQTVFAGRAAPAPSRQALADDFKGDPAGVQEQLPEAEARFAALDRRGRIAEIGWVGSMLDTFMHERRYPNDADTARILAALQEPRLFNTLVLASSTDTAREVTDFWVNLTSRAPGQVRSSPAELAALSSYLEGNGAKAFIALEQVVEPSDLSPVLNAALEGPVSPREWEKTRAANLVEAQRSAMNQDPSSLPRSTPPPPAPRSPGIPGRNR